jgi:glycosyltransferase involved in cell wall biosynthesis
LTARRTLLAATGDVNDIATWSGTPYHLLQTARGAGIVDEGLALEPIERFRQIRRYQWNLGAVLRGRGKGGYQFSVPCLERLWQPLKNRLLGNRVINCFQLYPPSVVADDSIERWYYIDQTLKQYFDHYGLSDTVSPWMQADALRRERQGYLRANGIVTHSHWAAESLVKDYQLAPETVKVIVPGANLDATVYQQWQSTRDDCEPGAGRPLRLVFVGKDPRRKGLDRLIRALQLARDEGAHCTLRVLGCTPDRLAPELRTVAGVEWRGFIHKQDDLLHFMHEIASCDIGCLLSRAEAGGMVLREYHALGLGVIGPDVGGSPDHVLGDASVLLRPDAQDDEVARLLLDLSQDQERVRLMREYSWAHKAEVSWTHSLSQLAGLLA